MSASTQRPCVLQEVFAVMGGGINEDQQPWVIRPRIVGEKKEVWGDLHWGLPLQAILGLEFQNGEPH